MTDKEEVALALLLWRAWRGKFQTSSTRDFRDVAGPNLDVSDRAIELAKLVGVKEEFFALLFKLPVMDITCKELEPWTSNEFATPTKKRNRTNPKRRYVSRPPKPA